MKVAIVCDWLTGVGGAERVVLELHRMFPGAPIYTSQYNPVKLEWFNDADVRTGWLQKLPAGLKKFLPIFRARFFSKLDLSGYDLVISSSGAEAKAVKTRSGATHICYMHAPTHYYWNRYEDYIKNPGFGFFDPLARFGLKLLVGPMRRWDYKAAQIPDYIITNSSFTKQQIKKYYGREATVIHPPVDIDRFKILNKSRNPREGYLAAGRQTPYKRIDLAVAACTELGLDLTVVGSGPDHYKLVKIAGPSVKFVEAPSDKVIVKYFQHSKAFIFPGIDDFGIVAVEALAAGTPVIAFRGGGALDYINPKTGIFFDKQTVKSLASALQLFDHNKYNSEVIASQAKQFSPAIFRDKVAVFIKNSTTG